jgi:hypothetical protein
MNKPDPNTQKTFVIKKKASEEAPAAPEVAAEQAPVEVEGDKQRLRLGKSGGATPAWADRERTVSPITGGKTIRTRKKSFVTSKTRRQAAASPAAVEAQDPGADAAGEPAAEPEEPKSFKVGGKTRIRKSKKADKSAARARARKKRSGGDGTKYFGLTVLGIAIAGLAGVGIWLARGDTMGHLGAVYGTVEVIMDEETTTPAKIDMRIASGYTVVSQGTNSRTFLLYPDEGRMQVSPDTKVQVDIVKLGTFKRGNKRVLLKEGSVFLEVPPQPPEKAMEANSPYSTSVFKQGRLALTYTNNIVRYDVIEGFLRVMRSEDKMIVDVPEGFYVVIAENMPFAADKISADTEVLSLTLIASDIEQPIRGFDPLVNDSVLNLGLANSALAIWAKTRPAVVGSLKFTLSEDGDAELLLNNPPYIFRGESGGGWLPDKGKYRLTAVAYSLPDGQGKPSLPKTVEFYVAGAR